MDRSSPSPSTSSRPVNSASPRLGASEFSQGTRNVLKHVIKTRKSWKSYRDGEVVWPVELEAALLEGLEKYVPQDTRETRILGRFPMRNRFISDYIYQKTGKRRSAKQVGSRIQQLRDTCAGKRLSKLLHPFLTEEELLHRASSPSHRNLRCDTESFSDASSIHSPTISDDMSSGCESQFSDDNSSDINPINVVYIDLLPDSLPLDEAGRSQLPCDLTSHVERVNHIQISQQPRHLRYIDPTITLVSPCKIRAQSTFTVRVQDTIVFTETTTLISAGSLNDEYNGAQLYRTPLVPGYWEVISHSADPTKFTIEQKVHKDFFTSSAPPLFCAIYKFRMTQKAQTACTPQQTHTGYSTTIDYFPIPDESGNQGPVRDLQSCEVPLDYPMFTMQSSIEAADQFIQFEDDDILTEVQSLSVPSSIWATSSPSAQSSSSLLSVSAASSRHNSRSPADSSISGTSPNCSSYTLSPMLYPVATAPSPSSCQLAGEFGVPATASYSGFDYFQHDFLNCVDIVIGNGYEIQSQ